MRLNADFSQRVVARTGAMDWTASPMPGVERKMLDRIGEEVARATSLVRYAPNSAFSAHTHGGGEEFLVLEGVFTDEHGDFPVGSYVRNPPTSSHTPSSRDGCVILVKLHQFAAEDRTHVRIASDRLRGVAEAARPGVTVSPLYADAREDVRIEGWAPGAEIVVDAGGGVEAFVLAGGFTESGETLAQGDWLRLPPGEAARVSVGAEGARVWLKSGHLSALV